MPVEYMPCYTQYRKMLDRMCNRHLSSNFMFLLELEHALVKERKRLSIPNSVADTGNVLFNQEDLKSETFVHKVNQAGGTLPCVDRPSHFPTPTAFRSWKFKGSPRTGSSAYGRHTFQAYGRPLGTFSRPPSMLGRGRPFKGGKASFAQGSGFTAPFGCPNCQLGKQVSGPAFIPAPSEANGLLDSACQPVCLSPDLRWSVFARPFFPSHSSMLQGAFWSRQQAGLQYFGEVPKGRGGEEGKFLSWTKSGALVHHPKNGRGKGEESFDHGLPVNQSFPKSPPFSPRSHVLHFSSLGQRPLGGEDRPKRCIFSFGHSAK